MGIVHWQIKSTARLSFTSSPPWMQHFIQIMTSAMPLPGNFHENLLLSGWCAQFSSRWWLLREQNLWQLSQNFGLLWTMPFVCASARFTPTILIRHLIHTQRMGAFGLSTTSSTTPDSSVLCSLQCDLYPSTVPLRLTQQWLEMPAWTLKTMIRKKRILHKFSSTGRWCSLKWCHNVVYITGTDWIGEIMLSGMDWIRKIVLIGMDWISG